MTQQRIIKYSYPLVTVKFIGNVGGWSHLRRVVKKWRKPQNLSD